MLSLRPRPFDFPIHPNVHPYLCNILAFSAMYPSLLRKVASNGICTDLGPHGNEDCALRVAHDARAGGRAAEYLSWFGGWTGGKVDAATLQMVVDTSAFALGMGGFGGKSGGPPTRLGFFGYPSLFNHDCAPNCWFTFVGEVMLIGSIARIPAGHEVNT